MSQTESAKTAPAIMDYFAAATKGFASLGETAVGPELFEAAGLDTYCNRRIGIKSPAGIARTGSARTRGGTIAKGLVADFRQRASAVRAGDD